MDKAEMEIQTKQQVETIMLLLTKLLVQFDLQLSINKSNGDFIFEKNDSNLVAVVGRGHMLEMYKKQQQILKEED